MAGNCCTAVLVAHLAVGGLVFRVRADFRRHTSSVAVRGCEINVDLEDGVNGDAVGAAGEVLRRFVRIRKRGEISSFDPSAEELAESCRDSVPVRGTGVWHSAIAWLGNPYQVRAKQHAPRTRPEMAAV